MSLTPPSQSHQISRDVIIHLRALRASVTRWRVISVVAVCAALAAAISDPYQLQLESEPPLPTIDSSAHVAQVNLNGIIISSRYRERMLEQLIESDVETALALVVHVDSPGGGVTASEHMLNQLLRFRETDRPIVFVMKNIAASGAYMAAMSSNRIYAQDNTITASIGAIAHWYQVDELLNEYGIKSARVRSGSLKGGIDPTAPPEEQTVQELQNIINEIGDWFVDVVTEHRKINQDTIKLISDGRIVRGEEAEKLGLIDEIGGDKAVKAWLAKEFDIPDDTNWKNYSLTAPTPAASSFLEAALKIFGLPATMFRKTDSEVAGGGFWAIWEPALRATR